MCISLKVASHYDLSVLSMSVTGFQKKNVDRGGWVVWAPFLGEIFGISVGANLLCIVWTHGIGILFLINPSQTFSVPNSRESITEAHQSRTSCRPSVAEPPWDRRRCSREGGATWGTGENTPRCLPRTGSLLQQTVTSFSFFLVYLFLNLHTPLHHLGP